MEKPHYPALANTRTYKEDKPWLDDLDQLLRRVGCVNLKVVV
jgi:hypothetical protein